MGGSLTTDGCNHVVGAIDAAISAGEPVIGIWHSAGAQLPDGIAAPDAVGRIFAAMVRASGRVAQISMVPARLSLSAASIGANETDIVAGIRMPGTCHQ